MFKANIHQRLSQSILTTLTSCIVMLGFFVVTRNEAGMEPQYNHNRPIYVKTVILAKTMNEHRRRKRDVDRPYVSPSSRSPAPKIQRKARSAMEAHKTLATSRNTPRMYVAQPSMHMLTVTDFKTSMCELESVAQLRHDIYTYLWLIKSSIPEKALIDYCMLTKPREEEQSCIVYFDVLDAIADIKITCAG